MTGDSYSTDGGGEGEGQADALAEIAEAAGIEAGDDLAEQVAALSREGAEPGGEDAADREGAVPSGASLADQWAAKGADDIASLGPRTLEGLDAFIAGADRDTADHVGQVADHFGVTTGLAQTWANLHDVMQAGAEPAPMRHDPAARDWFEDDGSLTSQARDFLRSDDPLASQLRADWGGGAERRMAAAMKLALNDAIVDPAVRRAFEGAGWQDQLAAIRQLDRVARRLNQRR